MKKLLGLVLCSALLVGAASIGRTAAAPVLEKESYPVILMPGILENALVRDKGTPKQKIIWFPMDRFLGAFLQHGPAILSCLARGDLDDIRKVGATVVTQIAEPIRIDPDGTSHYNISTLVSEAKECSYNALKKRGMLRRVTYGPMMLKEAAARVGGERAFVFQYDWRMSAVDIAKDLHSFIQDVKALTGSDKVCISGTSYGCNVLLCYLDAYGGENDLHSVLMNSPAYGGTEIFREMLGSDEPLHINYEGLFNMFLGNYGVEAELGYLLKLMPKGSIDVIFEGSLEKIHQAVLFVEHRALGRLSARGLRGDEGAAARSRGERGDDPENGRDAERHGARGRDPAPCTGVRRPRERHRQRGLPADHEPWQRRRAGRRRTRFGRRLPADRRAF